MHSVIHFALLVEFYNSAGRIFTSVKLGWVSLGLVLLGYVWSSQVGLVCEREISTIDCFKKVGLRFQQRKFYCYVAICR